MKLKIGADPELFLQDSAGRFVSAHDLLPGTKQEPFPVEGGAVQVDGTAAEFNIEPAEDQEAFVLGIQTVVGQLRDILGSHPDLQLVAAPTAVFDPDYFAGLPDIAKLLGCDPDYDAWNNGKVNHSPPGGDKTFRTGGGHIHLGWTEWKSMSDISHFYDCIEVTKQIDMALYIPSLLFDRDRQRQALYGKPGSFRAKPYGCEYRALSNRWVSDPELAKFVFNSASEAWHMLDQEEHRLYEKPELLAVFKNNDRTHDELVYYCKELYQWGMPPLPEKYFQEVQ